MATLSPFQKRVLRVGTPTLASTFLEQNTAVLWPAACTACTEDAPPFFLFFPLLTDSATISWNPTTPDHPSLNVVFMWPLLYFMSGHWRWALAAGAFLCQATGGGRWRLAHFYV